MSEPPSIRIERVTSEAAALRERLPEDQLRAHRIDREEEFTGRIAFLNKAMSSSITKDDAAYRDFLGRVANAVADVHEHGYAVIPGLIGPARVERLRMTLEPMFKASIDAFERLDATKPRQAFHIHNALAKTRGADELILDPFLRAVIGGTLGFDFTFHAGAIVTAHSPGCCDQPLHRDDASFFALPRPRMPLVLTAAISLDDFTTANGGTRVVPGSCWWERSRQPLAEEVLQVEMPAGSVLLWDGAIFHGAGANVTGGSLRRTVMLNYARGWLRTQFNQFLSVPRETVLALPAEIQKDLGYHTSLRGLGECDCQNALSYLQRLQDSGGDGVQADLGPETVSAR
jgi:hypothetical protein